MPGGPSALNYTPGEGTLQQVARKVIAAQSLRKQLFPSGMFGEPAWDILLSLYTHPEKSDRSISRLAQSSDAPLTTVVRWIQFLEDNELIFLESHGADRRADVVHLTDKAYRAMQFFLAQVLRGDH